MLASNKKSTTHRNQRQLGASLIEVLVSILLMSFGMLALGGMQAYSVAAQKSASNRTIASALANELAELIRLNRGSVGVGGFADGKYDIAMMPTSDKPALKTCDFPSCTSKTLAEADLTSFQNRVRNQLPLGGVELSRPTVAGVTSTTQADIWILWEEASVFNNTRTVSGNVQSAEYSSENCSANAKALATLPRCFYMRVEFHD